VSLDAKLLEPRQFGDPIKEVRVTGEYENSTFLYGGPQKLPTGQGSQPASVSDAEKGGVSLPLAS